MKRDNVSKAKTALITGAAVRLGREMALALADDGWDIALHYRQSKRQAEALATLIRAKGRKVALAQADLSDPEDVAHLIPSLADSGVTIDCLINNAALFEKDNLADVDADGLQSHMQVNCFAPLMLMRDFAAQVKGKHGAIINITDGMMGWSISPSFLSYSLSKLALANATQLLAGELAPNIRINAIAPGATLEGAQDKKDTFAKLEKIIPLHRTSAPEEIIATLRYILASPSLTGQIIALSGGLSLPHNHMQGEGVIFP